MARLRLVLIAAIAFAAGTVAYRWASNDRPYDAPPPIHHHRDAGVDATPADAGV